MLEARIDEIILGQYAKEIQRTRIILSSGYPLIRYALRTAFDKEQDLQVIAETGDGNEAVEIVARLYPDIVIMDKDMPMLDGIEATKQIKARSPKTKVIILSNDNEIDDTVEIQMSGASGRIQKKQP